MNDEPATVTTTRENDARAESSGTENTSRAESGTTNESRAENVENELVPMMSPQQ